MRKELDESLCKKYPLIFRDRHGDLRKTAMCWGIEIGDGWHDIIDKSCQLIQWHIDQRLDFNKRAAEQGSTVYPEIEQVVATQIKEKFGTLRFYYTGGDDYVDGVVAMAEAMSAVTCEQCGAPGKLRGGYWLYTACEEHTEEKDKALVNEE